MADEDKDLDKDLDEDLEDTSDDSGSDKNAPPDDKTPEDNSGKRINDLMSRAQKAEARAAKAEAALAAKGEATAPTDKDDADGKSGSGDEFVDFARENARTTLFNSDPRFTAYGLTAEAITGKTIAEMRQAFAAQKKLIDGIETAARQSVLREHGLDPEVSVGSASEKAPDFTSMSQEEFEKFLNKRDQRTY